MTLLHSSKHIGSDMEEEADETKAEVVETSRQLRTKVEHVEWNATTNLLFVTDNNGKKTSSTA